MVGFRRTRWLRPLAACERPHRSAASVRLSRSAAGDSSSRSWAPARSRLAQRPRRHRRSRSAAGGGRRHQEVWERVAAGAAAERSPSGLKPRLGKLTLRPDLQRRASSEGLPAEFMQLSIAPGRYAVFGHCRSHFVDRAHLDGHIRNLVAKIRFRASARTELRMLLRGVRPRYSDKQRRNLDSDQSIALRIWCVGLLSAALV